jgi:inner membrane protein
MPNRKEHMEAGAWTATGFAFVANVIAQAERKRQDPSYQFNPLECVGVSVAAHFVGRFAGQLPDLLEPAFHPGHRDLFHSVGFGALIVAGASKLNKNSQLASNAKFVVNTAAAAYISHLVLDGATPAGIPILI